MNTPGKTTEIVFQIASILTPVEVITNEWILLGLP